MNRADNWQTPKWLFNWIEETMGVTFTLDPCTILWVLRSFTPLRKMG